MTIQSLSLVPSDDPKSYYRRIAESINQIIANPGTATAILAGNNIWTGSNAFTGQALFTPGVTNGWIPNAGAAEIDLFGTLAAGTPDSRIWYQYVNASGWGVVSVNDALNSFHTAMSASVTSGSPAIINVSIGNTIDNPTISGNGVDITPSKSTFAIAASGFGSGGTGTARWRRDGDEVTLFVPLLTGTSNGTGFSFSLPAAIQPSFQQFLSVPQGLSLDNTANITDCSLSVNGATAQFFHNFSANGWTASGTKASGVFTVKYLLN